MINGELLIGGKSRRGSNKEIWAIEAYSGNRMEPSFGGAAQIDLDQACALAEEAFATFRSVAAGRRAVLLESVAQNILDLGETLIQRCAQETGLPIARLEGERARTVGQLRLFAAVLREGAYLDIRVDEALPDRTPLPRPDIRLRKIGIGPVAVFGASNFPLAFSVAGGDTASALAAGCPVVVKAHSAHLGTSELVGRAVQKAVQACNLPDGVFSLLFDSDRRVSQALVADPRIKAIGFTGSRSAGIAFMQIAASRPEPIPVYAEMSSINPVVLFPAALAKRGSEIGRQLIPAMTLGAGQFCTNPGLIVTVDGEGYAAFVASARDALSTSTAATMLTPTIHRAYCAGRQQLADHPRVTLLAEGLAGRQYQGVAALFETSAAAFMREQILQQEVFGATSLVVKCRDMKELIQLLQMLEGQLTIALHLDKDDYGSAETLIPLLETKAGRLIVNGFGTGVEVCDAMVHGGPYPATSDTRTTSVGTMAIDRFLRPVSYQGFPRELLPEELQQP